MRACKKLDNLLTKVALDKKKKSEGHNNDVGLATAFTSAEDFLGELDWESL